MKTVDTKFLNEEFLESNPIQLFQTVEDIILAKNNIREKNKGNNSSYITISNEDIVQVFGKLYGANKYEVALMCIALNRVSYNEIELFEIIEGNLTKLPEKARNYLLSLDRFSIFEVPITFDDSKFRDNENLRLTRYNYNLLEKLGDKKCALCECQIPQAIEGAHIWPIADIKKSDLNQEEKLAHALNGDNGLWLCRNHHKLLDAKILRLFEDNSVRYKTNLSEKQRNYLNEVTTIREIPSEFANDHFKIYLRKRNLNISEELYREFAN